MASQLAKNRGVSTVDDYMKTNQDWWNEAAQVHAQGDAYQLKAFQEGLIKLHRLERAEVGDVAGKKLLHLQCHFGLDTLSWARLGAQVTGVDYAENETDKGVFMQMFSYGSVLSYFCSKTVLTFGTTIQPTEPNYTDIE